MQNLSNEWMKLIHKRSTVVFLYPVCFISYYWLDLP